MLLLAFAATCKPWGLAADYATVLCMLAICVLFWGMPAFICHKLRCNLDVWPTASVEASVEANLHVLPA